MLLVLTVTIHHLYDYFLLKYIILAKTFKSLDMFLHPIARLAIVLGEGTPIRGVGDGIFRFCWLRGLNSSASNASIHAMHSL